MARTTEILITIGVIVGFLGAIVGIGFVPIPLRRCGESLSEAILSDRPCAKWGSVGAAPNPASPEGFCVRPNDTCFRHSRPLWRIIFPPHVAVRNAIILVTLVVAAIVIFTVLYDKVYYTVSDYHTASPCAAEGDHSEVSFPPVGVLQTRPMDDCAGLSESVCSGSYGCAFSGAKCGPLSCAGQDGASENKGACRTLAEGCGKDVPADKTSRGCYYEGKTPGDSASACTETTEGSRCLVYSTPCAYNTSTYSLSHSEFHHMARTR